MTPASVASNQQSWPPGPGPQPVRAPPRAIPVVTGRRGQVAPPSSPTCLALSGPRMGLPPPALASPEKRSPHPEVGFHTLYCRD